jgi:sugar lactone lactonase YvrE
MQISRIETETCLVGEGPLWDPAGQALFFLDITGRKAHRYEPSRGETRSWSLPSSIGALAMRASGGAVVALADGVHALDLDDGSLTRLAPLQGVSERARFNDGRTDRQGRFVLGLSDGPFKDIQPVGGICSLGPDHQLRLLETGVHFSNSACFSPDGRTFYFADSYLYSLFAYDYDPATGNLSNKRLFVDTRPLDGMPDGATVDQDGLVWMAIFRAGKVAAFRPGDGKLERVVDMPVSLVSSVAFGGPELDQLYVTSLDASFFGDPPEAGAGHLYRVDGLGARGVPETPYAG